MNHIYKYQEFKPKFSIALGITSFIAVLSLANEQYLIGLIILFTGIIYSLLTLYEWLIIDKNKYKKTSNYILYKYGKWETFSDIGYVSVSRMKKNIHSYKVSTHMIGQSPSNNFTYKVNLVYNDKKKKPLQILTKKQDIAIKEALRIGEYLNLKVLDYSTPDKKWIRN